MDYYLFFTYQLKKNYNHRDESHKKHSLVHPFCVSALYPIRISPCHFRYPKENQRNIWKIL